MVRPGKPQEQTELSREQCKIVDDWLPMVQLIAFYEHQRSGMMELAEYEALGSMGLIDAVLRFDEKKGDDLEKFAKKRIRGAMRDAVRKLGKDARRRAQTWDATEDGDGILTEYGPPIDLEEFLDPVTTLSTKLAKEQLKAMARAAMEELDEDDRALAQAVIIDDVSLGKHGEQIGVSKSTVKRRYNKLRNDLYSRWIRRTGEDEG